MKNKYKYKTYKVFDCQDMPDDLCSKFLETYEKSNDVYVSWTIKGSSPEYVSEEEKEIDAWLIANGADDATSPDESGETVIIQYWW